MHEWPVRRAAPQHSGWLLKGGSGPFVSFDTNGGKRSFAAYAKLADPKIENLPFSQE
jgi:hypothetical protein